MTIVKNFWSWCFERQRFVRANIALRASTKWVFFHFNHSFNLSEQCALHLKWAIFSLRLLYPHFRQGTPTHRAPVHQYTWKNWAIRSPTSSKQCMLFHLSALGLAQTKQHASAKYVLLWNLMHSTKFSAFFLYSV